MLQSDFNLQESKYLSDYCKIVYLQENSWFKPGSIKAILGYFMLKPRSVYASYDKTFQEAVDFAIEDIKPDIIIASTLGSVEYIKPKQGIKTIFDHHNCDYASLKRTAISIKNPIKRLLAELGIWKTAKYELAQCRKFDFVIVVSESDNQSLKKLDLSITNIRVVPNAIDVDYYNPNHKQKHSNQLIYNGSPTFSANYDAICYFEKEIFPLITTVIPKANLKVTGRTDGTDLSELSNTEFIGYQQDIRQILYESSVCLVPLRQGGGTRLKILEAMAAGVPVVSTAIGAEGLNTVNGEHLLIADTPKDFADAVIKLINNPELAEKIRINARKLVCDEYSFEEAGKKFIKVLGEAKAK